MLSDLKVGVVETEPLYLGESPYNPQEAYPEYPFGGNISSCANPAYEGVRELFHVMGYDASNFGTPHWNPLGFLVKPGMTVVLKPNFVLSFHKYGKDLYSIVTHPSVLRAVADYCWIALNGRGKIIIADAPQYNCDFNELMLRTGLPAVAALYESYQGPGLEIRDLRGYWAKGRHFPSLRRDLPGDPEGSTLVNLGSDSAFYGRDSSRFYGAVYHRQETISHHDGEKQEYIMGNTFLRADVVISMPKLKVHKKVGVTLNAKGFVGSAANKNLLVHYALGTPSQGGDQFPDDFLRPHERFLIKLERTFYDMFLARQSILLEYVHRSLYFIHSLTTRRLGLTVGRHMGYPKRMFDAGNWHGNDTAWRMTVDLMKIMHFTDKDGIMRTSPQRKIYSIIDGIIGGQGAGPLEPDPAPAGLLIGGTNPLAVDLVATRLMGFDPLLLKIYQNLLSDRKYDFKLHDPKQIDVASPNRDIVECFANETGVFRSFEPHPGWKGHIEVNRHEIMPVIR